MMNKPPIDELAKKVGSNKYALCCVVSKRAKEIEKKRPQEVLDGDKKAISLAMDELYNGQVVPNDDNI